MSACLMTSFSGMFSYMLSDKLCDMFRDKPGDMFRDKPSDNINGNEGELT